jgi:hypothetical protein
LVWRASKSAASASRPTKLVAPDRAGDAGHDDTELAALAFDGVAENQRRESGIGRGPRRCGKREGGGDHDADGILGWKFFWRLAASGESRRRGRRQIDAVARHDLVDVSERAGVGDGRPRGDGGGIISGDIADRQGYNASRTGGERKAATLDAREMFAHSVHLDDVGAARQQASVDGLLVGQGHLARGQHHQGRTAA